jgi:hypothetical protein
VQGVLLLHHLQEKICQLQIWQVDLVVGLLGMHMVIQVDLEEQEIVHQHHHHKVILVVLAQ